MMTPKGLTIMTMAAMAAAVLSTTFPAMARGPGEGPMGGGPMMEMFDFAVIDTDKDGKITMEEIEVYRASRVQGVDANNDGKLSVDELTAMEMKRMEEVARSKAARMVERFDADGDGQLSAAELASRPVPMRMFDRIDTDGDNAISQAEVDAARDRMAERMKDGKHHRRPAPPPMEAPDDGPEGDDN